MNIFLLLATLATTVDFTANCRGLTCTFVATSSGPVSAYTFTLGDGSKKLVGQTIQHTYDQAGVYTVLLVANDGSRRPQKSRKVVVTKEIVRVDTVRIASKPDTIRLVRVDTLMRTVVDTVRITKRDTVAYALSVPFVGAFPGSTRVAVDSAGNQAWRVWRMTFMGTVDHHEGYRAFRYTTTQSPFLLSVFAGRFSTLDSAVTRILTTP